MVKKIGFSFAFIAVLFSSASVGVSVAADLPLEAYGLDTIAGYSTYLRTSKTVGNASIVFEVTNPDGETTQLSAISNSEGVAQTELSDYYTRKAGNYSVSAKLENNVFYGNLNSFTVYPGELSQTVSTLSPGEQIVRSYLDQSQITVKLSDDYENPIEGHLVKLISSSDMDVIESDSDFTDSSGEIVFNVSSESVGTVSYSAYDVTADEVLLSRAKVVYFDSNDYIFVNDVPEGYQFAATGNSSSAVDSFEFEDVPSSIGVGESITFDLSAKDAFDQVVTGYDGTVRFSVVSDNSFYANLPEDYIFTVQDLGSHTFSLAMSFQQAGTYSIEARDMDSVDVYGEYDFVVTDEGSGQSGGVNISNPVSGTYSNNIQVISGTATAGSALKIFDNDIEIASLVADAFGAFSYTTGALSDGAHDFYVATVNEVGTITGTSETVSVMIDTSGPQVSQVVLEPSSAVDPGAIVTVKLYTPDDLSQAAILFQGNIYETVKSADGYYQGSFAAPIEFGEYPVDFVVVDQLGNESNLENQAVVSVGLLPAGDVVLGDVSGLTADSSDRRVTLEWDPVLSSTNDIANYRVYYGLSPNQLTEAVDTFTASTTWYVPNLKNEVEYYFAVIAVDSAGDVSEHFSNIVSTVPGPDVVDVVSPEVTMGTAGSEALEDMERDPSEAGPEIMWLVLCSLMGGAFYTFSVKRKCEVDIR